jgi:hypothetical protein
METLNSFVLPTSALAAAFIVTEKMPFRGSGGFIEKAKLVGVRYTATSNCYHLKKEIVDDITKHYLKQHTEEG